MRLSYALAAATGAGVAVVLIATGPLTAAARDARSVTTTSAAAKRFAPYVDLGEGRPGLLRKAIAGTPLRTFSAGFVLGRGCRPVWDDGKSSPVSTDKVVDRVITSAEHKGVAVVVSFGGAAGTELAQSCHDVHRLTAAYRSVVRRFSLTRVDFDIEGDELTDHASVVRRFHAIHALEHADPKLGVSLTLPSGVHGMRPVDDPHVLAIVRQAKAEHVRVALVNLMAMDYYDGIHHDMATAAITAAKAGLRQLRGVWPGSTYRRIGITPMIGVNDDTSEVFTLADAKALDRFAATHHLGRVGFWSIGRDRTCTGSAPQPRSTCSGVAQHPLAFTRALLG
ncbi:MAG TPA: chitinase [Mycobacteriales bacterium]|nr:chitinase [Mycobacteriales bacterium]